MRTFLPYDEWYHSSLKVFSKGRKSLGDKAGFVWSLNPEEWILTFPVKPSGCALQALKVCWRIAKQGGGSTIFMEETFQGLKDRPQPALYVHFRPSYRDFLYHVSTKIKADARSSGPNCMCLFRRLIQKFKSVVSNTFLPVSSIAVICRLLGWRPQVSCSGHCVFGYKMAQTIQCY